MAWKPPPIKLPAVTIRAMPPRPRPIVLPPITLFGRLPSGIGPPRPRWTPPLLPTRGPMGGRIVPGGGTTRTGAPIPPRPLAVDPGKRQREEAERQRREHDRQQREQADRARREQERLAHDRADREQRTRAEADRQDRLRQQRERLERERLDRERRLRDRDVAESLRLRLERQSQDRNKLDRERLDRERIRRERDRLERERLTRQMAQATPPPIAPRFNMPFTRLPRVGGPNDPMLRNVIGLPPYVEVRPDHYEYRRDEVIGHAIASFEPADQIVMTELKANPSKYFPFGVEPRKGENGIQQDGEYYLVNVTPLLPGRFPVTVSEVTPVSFTFTAGLGHFDPEGSTISFTTYIDADNNVHLQHLGWTAKDKSPMAGDILVGGVTMVAPYIADRTWRKMAAGLRSWLAEQHP